MFKLFYIGAYLGYVNSLTLNCIDQNRFVITLLLLLLCRCAVFFVNDLDSILLLPFCGCAVFFCVNRVMFLLLSVV